MLNNKNLAAMEMTDDDMENVIGGLTYSTTKKFNGSTFIQNGIVCAITAAGDDIMSIANHFGVALEKLKSLNPGMNLNFLPALTQLNLGKESEVKTK